MKNSPVIFIKELSEQYRPFMLNHFLGLSPSDRRLRFGAALPDVAVSRYVQRIDFTRDTVFGVYVGTKLFDRAAIHCRNHHVNTLYIHCLASNKPMLCIAEKAGMKIHKDHGEVDGYLHLPGPDSESFRREHAEEKAASLDYALNGRMRNAVRWLRNLVSPEKGVKSSNHPENPPSY